MKFSLRSHCGRPWIIWLQLYSPIFFGLFSFSFFFFLGPCLPHMEASRLGVELELQLLACATGQGWSPCPHGWILVKVVTAEPQGELLRPNINVRSRFPLTFLPHRPTLHPWMYFCHFLFQLYVVNLCSTLSDSVTPMQPSKLSSMVLFTMFPQRGWVYSLLLEYVLVYTLHRVLTDYHLTFVFLSIYIFICIIYVLLYMYTICIISIYVYNTYKGIVSLVTFQISWAWEPHTSIFLPITLIQCFLYNNR